MRRHGWFTFAVVGLVGGAAVAAQSIGSTAQAPTAAFAYKRIANRLITTGEGPVLVGDRVLVGARRRGHAVVRVLGLDGSVRGVVRVPHAGRTVGDMAASEQAVAVITGTPAALSVVGASARGVPAAFGRLGGPLRAFPSQPSDVGVAGSLVVAFDHELLLVWDVNASDAPPRRISVPSAALLVGAAGHYVAVLVRGQSQLQVVVVDLRSGREVFRVPTQRPLEAAIGPDGRVVVLERAARATRIVTATPAEAARREVARMPLSAPRVSVTESGVAVVRKAPGGLAQIVVVGYDGSQRPVTPALNGIRELDYDGARLAFTAGRCVFAGPVPAGRPGAAPRDPCLVEAASLDFRRLGRDAQRSGSRVRVPLTCTVPPGTHCTAHLRLAGPGFVVHRRARILPGRHVVHVRIPAAHRRAAWRMGMTLETLERGRASSGAVIPQ